MQELDQLKEALCKQRPVDWEELPDLDLYMDQVITYMYAASANCSRRRRSADIIHD